MKFILILALITVVVTGFAQDGDWEVYLAQYEKGPGSTIVNMDLKNNAPEKNFPFLFSAGVNFTNCTADGFPANNEFDKLNRISDSIKKLVNRLVKNIQVGTFTYQCQRRDYYYVADTTGLRQKTTTLIKERFPGYKPAFNVKTDKEWEAYLDFLYPSETIQEYIKNQKVIAQLEKAGDKLDKPRQVDHWLYFKTDEDRNCFIRYAQSQRYKIEGKETMDDTAFKFKLQISRTDKVDLSSVSKLTLSLEQEAKKCNGDYDGWETVVVK